MYLYKINAIFITYPDLLFISLFEMKDRVLMVKENMYVFTWQ